VSGGGKGKPRHALHVAASLNADQMFFDSNTDSTVAAKNRPPGLWPGGGALCAG
jgi:hypothetical protein